MPGVVAGSQRAFRCWYGQVFCAFASGPEPYKQPHFYQNSTILKSCDAFDCLCRLVAGPWRASEPQPAVTGDSAAGHQPDGENHLRRVLALVEGVRRQRIGCSWRIAVGLRVLRTLSATSFRQLCATSAVAGAIHGANQAVGAGRRHVRRRYALRVGTCREWEGCTVLMCASGQS